MNVAKFYAKSKQKLSKFLLGTELNLSYNQINKIIRNKDVKVNGKRTGEDIDLSAGDEIQIYYKESKINFYEVIYQDENVLVVSKKQGIEVVSENKNDLLSLLKNELELSELYAVHRLDRNTQGLVIFAKNIESKIELDNGFKNRNFEKKYLALAYGQFEKKEINYSDFLLKDKNNSLVKISNKKLTDAYVAIKTNVKVIKQYENFALVEVDLVTGKTHQIRAHLAFHNHYILGDEKYGKIQNTIKTGVKYQNLLANKLKLHFLENEKLFYLNNKEFEIKQENVDFLKNL